MSLVTGRHVKGLHKLGACFQLLAYIISLNLQRSMYLPVIDSSCKQKRQRFTWNLQCAYSLLHTASCMIEYIQVAAGAATGAKFSLSNTQNRGVPKQQPAMLLRVGVCRGGHTVGAHVNSIISGSGI